MADVYNGRNAEILESVINDTEYDAEPQSVIEELLLELKSTIKASGLPEAPTTDGEYTLKCTVAEGVATYEWV